MSAADSSRRDYPPSYQYNPGTLVYEGTVETPKLESKLREREYPVRQYGGNQLIAEGTLEYRNDSSKLQDREYRTNRVRKNDWVEASPNKIERTFDRIDHARHTPELSQKSIISSPNREFTKTGRLERDNFGKGAVDIGYVY